MKTSKAVIYARYSSERQTEQSIEGQLRECQEFAKANNIMVIGTYIDRAKTGTNDHRAEFQKMLRDSRRHTFDTVIVWKIDRFGRNREDIAKNKAILRVNGVTVLYAREHIPDGPEGIILESVLEGLAEYYSMEMRQKILRGMRESALKCQFNGSGLPLGYKTDANKRFVIDPDGAAVVRLIFESYDHGMSIAAIVRMLNEKQLTTLKGKSFVHTGVSRILRNRRYTGEYCWHDVVTPGGMPQIIDTELFDRVQQEMDKNKRAPARIRDDSEPPFLLTTKLFCGHCKSTMIGDSGTSKSGQTYYYYTCCARKKKRNPCKKKSVPKEALERRITALTVANVLQDDIMDRIAERVSTIHQKERDDQSMLQYYESRLAETQTTIKNIMKAIEAGVFTQSTRERLLELETERDNLKANIEKEKIVRPVISTEEVLFFLHQFKGGKVEDPEYQKRIIDLFINKIFLYDDRLVITYNFSGESSEILVDNVESAVEKAESGVYKCSDVLAPSPPINRGRYTSMV